MTPCPKAAFLKSSVVVKWSYVSPLHVAKQIRHMRQTCDSGTFLDCVVEYDAVRRVTGQFAALHSMPDIADPAAFLGFFEEVHLVRDVDDLEAR